jgi:hypothetical protein
MAGGDVIQQEPDVEEVAGGLRDQLVHQILGSAYGGAEMSLHRRLLQAAPDVGGHVAVGLLCPSLGRQVEAPHVLELSRHPRLVPAGEQKAHARRQIT